MNIYFEPQHVTKKTKDDYVPYCWEAFSAYFYIDETNSCHFLLVCKVRNEKTQLVYEWGRSK